MSLLMQALRKAEEAKRAAAEAASTSTAASPPAVPETAALALEPLVRTNPPVQEVVSLNIEPPLRTEPTLAPSAETVSAPVQKVAPPATPQAPQVPPRAPVAEQRAAQNVFAAKTGQRNNTFILVVAGSTLLALVGIGAYFWWQLRPSPSLTPPPLASRPPATAAAPVAMPATPAVAASAPATPAAAVAGNAPAVRSTEAVAPPPSLFASPAPRTSSAAPIRLSSSKPTLNPLATQGYDAMQAGNLNQAQQLYQKLLATDPLQLDALYGLAAIAVQRNQTEQAEDYYLRILEIDPRDAYANAGLIGLHAKAPGENLESRLKTLLADRPSPVLHFALGNVYAKQERWREAQQAYFSAFQGDNDNPDFAFNLAISLDQLRQPKLAAQYYGVALKLARQRTAAFNPTLVQERMRELQAQ